MWAGVFPDCSVSTGSQEGWHTSGVYPCSHPSLPTPRILAEQGRRGENGRTHSHPSHSLLSAILEHGKPRFITSLTVRFMPMAIPASFHLNPATNLSGRLKLLLSVYILTHLVELNNSPKATQQDVVEHDEIQDLEASVNHRRWEVLILTMGGQ